MAGEMNTFKYFMAGCLLLCSSWGVPDALAQENATLTGTITDSNGAVIQNAEVAARNTATGELSTRVSNASGIYNFQDLHIGSYTLIVTAPGFQKYTKTGLTLNVATTAKNDVVLAVGSQSNTVTVQANALQLQTETNEVGNLITGSQIRQLATNGRNILSLTTLGTGVSANLPSFNGVDAQGSSFAISFNGMRPDHNEWLIDGAEISERGSGGKLIVMPNIDVLAEFRVLGSNYSPDYGISSGGTVTMVTRSGTRDIHGAAWEFNRNDMFDANNYFSKQNKQPIPELRLNIFGGAIGGPVVIPHFYNKDRSRTFFFWSEEGRRYIQGSNPSVTTTIPTADFPVAGQPLVYQPPAGGSAPVVPATLDPARLQLYKADGLTPGQPFPNSTIPANLIDPNAVLFMGTGAIPKPNTPDGTNNFVTSVKQPTYVREDLVRVDHTINSKLQLMGHYLHDAANQSFALPLWSGDSFPTVGSTFTNPAWSGVVKLTQMLSPTLLNETAVSFNRNVLTITPTGTFTKPANWTAASFYTGNNALNRLPDVSLGAPYNVTYSAAIFPWTDAALDYQLRDDLSWQKGSHGFSFGFSFMRFANNQQIQAETQGAYHFSTPAFSGDSYVNFLLGTASSYSQLQDMTTDHWLTNTFSGYANDNWKITKRLTLNLGVRYDAYPHAYEKNNFISNFIPSAYSSTQSPIFNPDGSLDPTGPGFIKPNGASIPFYLNGIREAGVNGFPRGIVKNYYGTVGPRVGFAMDVFGDGKTALRGGAGIFYERIQGNDIYNADTNPPFAAVPQANNVYFSNPFQSANSGLTAAQVSFPQSLTSLAYNYHIPATLQFSLGLQQQWAPAIVSVIQYVGSSGWHQDDNRAINTLPLNSPNRQAVAEGTFNADEGRQYLGYSGITQEEVATNSQYHSLQAGLRIEAKHGVTLQLSYTWSHEIDIVSGDLASVSNPFNLRYDRGSGSLDRRNNFSANYIYALPFYKQSSRQWERQVLGGWEVSGITIAQSGTPAVVTYAPDTLGLGGGTSNRPDQLRRANGPKKQLQWFNTAVFSAPAAPWAGGANEGFGTAGKDAVVGPGLFNFNLSLFKSFPLSPSDRTHLELRAESFNTFNHTQFQNVDTELSDSKFGQVTSTYDPRILQFGAKLTF
jgi:hypothetical protein